MRRVMEKATVTVSADGETLYKKAREHMAPGEMERLILPASLFAKAKGALRIDAIPSDENEKEAEGV